MWHYRSVFSPLFLYCSLAVSSLLLSPVEGFAQPQGHAPGKATPSPPETRANPHDQTQQLAALMEAQSAAVAGGDPAAIADASRGLNAQVYMLLAELRLAEAKSQEATGLWQQSLDQQSSTERRLQFASALLRSGNPSAALAETETVLAAEPDNAIAWMTRGSALKDLGRGQEAIDALTHALQLRPEPRVAFALGSTYLSLKQKEKADGIFKRLLEATGSSPYWQVAIGDAYRGAGDMKDAVANLQAALARDPKAPHGEFFLGLAYLQMNQWGPNRDSFEHLRRSVLQNPHEYPNNFYLGAMESTEGSDLAASDRHLEAAAAADPTAPEVWLYLGMNANREKRLAAAKADLRKSIDLTGRDEARNHYQIRRAYFTLGRLLVAEGNRVEGEALLARYRTAQQSAIAESGQAIAQAENGAAAPLSSLAAATPAAAEPAAESPEENQVQAGAEAKLKTLLASSLNDLGTAEARQHDYAAALAAFQQSEQADPSNPLVLRNLGTAAFRAQNNAEAARALELYRQEQTESGQPIDPHAQLLLAMAEFALGKFHEASGSFGAAGSLTMQDSRTAYSYAFALARTGQAQESNRIADQLVSEPLPEDVLPLVCHIYIDTEDYEGSNTCYRKALEKQPGLPLAHYEIGESLIRLDRPSEAIPELRQELPLSPGNPNVLTALGLALLQTSNKAEARLILQSTVQAHPEHAEAQYEYGKLLLEEGDAAEGIRHLELSRNADPSKDYVHYQLGMAYRKAGRGADAEAELRAYREIKDRTRNARATAHESNPQN